MQKYTPKTPKFPKLQQTSKASYCWVGVQVAVAKRFLKKVWKVFVGALANPLPLKGFSQTACYKGVLFLEKGKKLEKGGFWKKSPGGALGSHGFFTHTHTPHTLYTHTQPQGPRQTNLQSTPL